MEMESIVIKFLIINKMVWYYFNVGSYKLKMLIVNSGVTTKLRITDNFTVEKSVISKNNESKKLRQEKRATNEKHDK